MQSARQSARTFRDGWLRHWRASGLRGYRSATSREALAAPLSTSREMPLITLIHSFDTQW